MIFLTEKPIKESDLLKQKIKELEKENRSLREENRNLSMENYYLGNNIISENTYNDIIESNMSLFLSELYQHVI